MNLQSIYNKFPTEEKFIKHLEKVFWDNEPRCPYCKSTYQTPAPKEKRYHCNKCGNSYRVTTQTVFHKTRVDLRKWAFVIDFMLRSQVITVRELGEILDVTKDTAALLINRIEPRLNTDKDLFRDIVNF